MQPPARPVNVLVVFYSRGGLTERLAVLIAEGALQGGANIRLRRARDTASEDVVSDVPGWRENRDRMHSEFAAPREVDVEWADAIAFGTPAAHSAVSEELQLFLDQLKILQREGKLAGKLSTAFTSSYAANASGRASLADLQGKLLNLGFIVAPDPMSNHAAKEDDFELARLQGHRLAKLAWAICLYGRSEGSADLQDKAG